MMRNSTNWSLTVLLAVSIFFLGGCGAGTTQKTVPHMGFGNLDIRTQISREDIVVLGRVEGTSTTKSIFGGVIQVIDGNKLRFFGIPFFKEKYTDLGGASFWATTAERAYYKALEAAPEADTVFLKSMDNEVGGVPFLWCTKTVTWKGKAIKLKEDQKKEDQ